MNTEPSKFEVKLGGVYPIIIETHGDMTKYLKSKYNGGDSSYSGYGKSSGIIGSSQQGSGGYSTDSGGIGP